MRLVNKIIIGILLILFGFFIGLNFDNFKNKSIKIFQNNQENQFCGGIANIQCPEEYECVIKDKYPDAGGVCVKKIIDKNFTCPKTGYIDCMPGPDKKPECNPNYLEWVKKNCPNFKGIAY